MLPNEDCQYKLIRVRPWVTGNYDQFLIDPASDNKKAGPFRGVLLKEHKPTNYFISSTAESPTDFHCVL